MRIAFLGTPDFALASLRRLVEADHEIACVYSQPPAPRGRGQELKPSPVHAFALERGLPVRTPTSMRDPAEIAAFQALALDAAVVVAFGQIPPRFWRRRDWAVSTGMARCCPAGAARRRTRGR